MSWFNSFKKRRQEAEALACFDEAINCGYVDNGDVYIDRGICLQSLNYDLDAIDDFDRAIALQPENSLTFHMRSISKSSTGDFRGCVSDLQEAIRLAGIDNKYTRNQDAHVRETGYKDSAHYYRLQMDFAKTTLDQFEDSVARSGWTGLHARERYEKKANKRRRGSTKNAEAIMNPKRVWEVALTMLGAILLLIASNGRHPYGFYVVLRLVITVGAVYWAWRVYKVGLWAWSWVFAAVALLLNPFLPIRMQRSQWQPIDLSLGVLAFVWCGYWLIRKRGAA